MTAEATQSLGEVLTDTHTAVWPTSSSRSYLSCITQPEMVRSWHPATLMPSRGRPTTRLKPVEVVSLASRTLRDWRRLDGGSKLLLLGCGVSMPEMKPFIARLDAEVLPGRQSRGRHNPSLSAGAKSGHLLCVNIDTVWQGSPLIEGRQWIAEETGTPDLNINFSCFLAPWSSRALHMPKLGTKQPAPCKHSQ